MNKDNGDEVVSCRTETIEKLMMESLVGERQRYESMLGTAGRMIAGLSLVSVALATVMPVLLGAFPCYGRALAMEFSVLFALAISSLFSAVLSQFRRTYKGLSSPGSILSDAKSHGGRLDDPDECCDWLGCSLDATYKGLNSLNNWMGNCLRVANVLLMADLILIALFGAVDAIVFLTAGY